MTSNFLGLGLAMGLVLVACGGRTPIGTVVYLGDDGSVVPADASVVDVQTPPGLRTALVRDSCSPTDGTAFQFSIGSTPMQCNEPPSPSAQLVDILYWAPLSGPGTYPLKLSMSGSGNATAAVCSGGPCKVASSGTLTLTTFSPKGATVVGSYVLGFPDGTSQSGSFTATQCHSSPMCG